ncbi:diguanylate cyclase [Sulfurimonas lithotrophica]|uniref:diguanylate cyclase n=1 Tax=Sulfurimonas lithotrophica TaxID=2590022 RepID=A0A5P8P4J4_9BACT|nr:diguanylate cyclase [Sulfurimonas lithotrophica]
MLCVDDVKTNLLTLEAIFESNDEDYNLLMAMSGQEALDILQTNEVDLILLDVMMPELNGFDTAKLILKNKKTKDIPIIFLTAKQDDETIKMSYEVGGVDYMNKPFNVTELLKRIDFHLRLKKSEKLIHIEKEQIQSLINLQDNFVLLTDGVKAIKINSAIEDFFQVKSISEFQEKYGCICKTFIEENGYYHLGLVDTEELWISDVIERLKNEDVIVKIKDIENNNHIFAIKAVKFENSLFILSFTDITSMSEQSREYEYEASHDPLTSIYNRNMFVRVMKEKIKQRIFTNKGLSLCVLDIDHFKDVNDTYGHLVGDNVLKHLARLIEKHIRSEDLFARWGGEEFILVFEFGINEAYRKVEFLRKIIEKENFGTVGSLTCSFGVSEYKYGDTLESLINEADKALYEAKASGRNMVCQI